MPRATGYSHTYEAPGKEKGDRSIMAEAEVAGTPSTRETEPE
jgi:hypothetical protein